MHPFLRNAKQFLIVGLLWSPLSIWVVFLLTSMLRISWWEAAVWVVPPMAAELFICFSTWYLCRTTSKNKWYPLKTILVHITAALILNLIWLLFIRLYSDALFGIFEKEIFRSLFMKAAPIFIAVGLSLYFISILGHYLALAMEKNRKTEQEVLKHKLLTSQSELKALKSTVHPHFLFNSLNMLSPLIRSTPDKAQTVVSQLSEFLLYSMRYGQKEWVTVQDEVEHIENYLGIEGIRLGDRLKTSINIDSNALQSRMPSLSLLPLVENAIKHGISQCLEGGTLSIQVGTTVKSISRDSSKKSQDDNDHYIDIEISNPYDQPSRPLNGEGMGLTTLKQRFDSLYGENCRLTSWRKDIVFYVKLQFPQFKPEDLHDH
jgi:two-component system, LytTR family, sensor kinase